MRQVFFKFFLNFFIYLLFIFILFYLQNQLLLSLAVKTRTLAAVVYQVPNQPLQFSGDKLHSRSEDDIIACEESDAHTLFCLQWTYLNAPCFAETYRVQFRSSILCILVNAKTCSISTDTWARFFEDTRRTEWPAHIPMTKATVRALDTVQAYASSQLKLQVVLCFQLRKH